MLSLSRKVGERVYVGEDIIVEVTEIKGGKVRLDFTAPKDVRILREEIKRKDEQGGAGEVGDVPRVTSEARCD